MYQKPIALIAGTRPELIKTIPVYFAFKKQNLPVLFCVTGQHNQLAQQVLDLFGVNPDFDLQIMQLGQDPFYVTHAVLHKIKDLFKQIDPSCILVQGDTTSAMAAALAAFYLKIPIGHIEAGLRTYDLYAPFPEEANRKIIGSIAQFHFAPTKQAVNNLLAENISQKNIFLTGNTVVDALHLVQDKIQKQEIMISDFLKNIIAQAKLKKQKIMLLTIHRREAFDGGIDTVLQTIKTFLTQNEQFFCVYVYHPNPKVIQAIKKINLHACQNMFLHEPLSYEQMVYFLLHADLVVTDSGGLQEEAISLEKPVVVLREKTERMEGVDTGLAHLVGYDGKKIMEMLEKSYPYPSTSSGRTERDTELAFTTKAIGTSKLSKGNQNGTIQTKNKIDYDSKKCLKSDIYSFFKDFFIPVRPELVEGYERKKPMNIYGDGTAALKIVEILQKKIDTLNFDQPIKKQVQIKKEEFMLEVCILGLGYIGLPTAIMLADAQMRVVGVDVDQVRVQKISAGDPVIKEPEIFERLQCVLQSKQFIAQTNITPADYFIIAVPTPLTTEKKADLSFVFTAVKNISAVLKKGDCIIIESTISVGTTTQVAKQLEKQTGLKAGTDFFVAHCPERVLPGKIFYELVHNDRIVGGINEQSTQKAIELYRTFVQGKIYATDATSAELIKLIENASRDVQIAFAHQVNAMAQKAGLDPYTIIELANKHPRVNILKPSCGVGGHCIAVDPWFLIETFKNETTLLQQARAINDNRPIEVITAVEKEIKIFEQKQNKKPVIGLLGLTYKPNVDDLRESPALFIAQQLIQKHELRVADPFITKEKVPALSKKFCSTMHAVQEADIIIFLVGHDQFFAIDQKMLLDKKVIDFCGIAKNFSDVFLQEIKGEQQVVST